jgi:hypothetical protein
MGTGMYAAGSHAGIIPLVLHVQLKRGRSRLEARYHGINGYGHRKRGNHSQKGHFGYSFEMVSKAEQSLSIVMIPSSLRYPV